MKRQRVSVSRTSPPYKESLISCELIGSDEDGYLTFVDGLPVIAPGGGGSGTPAVSVEDETTFGLSSDIGVSSNYARQDHTHGTPDLPTASDIGAEEEGVAATLITTHEGLSDPHTQYQKESEKSSAGGYASLDGSIKVPIAELPTGTTGSTVALGNAVATHEGLSDPHTQYQKESEKSSASGYASLDAGTKVPIAELPTGTSSSTVALGDHMQTVALGGTNKSSWNANSILIATSSTVLSDMGSGVAGQVAVSGGPSSPPTWSTRFVPIKTIYTSGSGTIAEPVGASRIFLRGRAGGGGGGGGRRGAAGSSRGGGGGGSSGSYAELSFDITSVINWPLSYTIGAKGTGGAGATADNTNGSPGNDGTATVVTDSSGEVIFRTLYGRLGAGGTAATAAGGAAFTTKADWAGLGGGSGSTTGGTAPTDYTHSSGGGGGGAGITSGNSSNPGRAGGIGGNVLNVSGTSNAGAGGLANGGNGGDATETPARRGSGGGGGGGGGDSAATIPGGRGGHGIDGSGGGGGGGSTNGQNAGNGGDGGDGFLEYCAI